jgi:hypothetical protein
MQENSFKGKTRPWWRKILGWLIGPGILQNLTTPGDKWRGIAKSVFALSPYLLVFLLGPWGLLAGFALSNALKKLTPGIEFFKDRKLERIWDDNGRGELIDELKKKKKDGKSKAILILLSLVFLACTIGFLFVFPPAALFFAPLTLLFTARTVYIFRRNPRLQRRINLLDKLKSLGLDQQLSEHPELSNKIQRMIHGTASNKTFKEVEKIIDTLSYMTAFNKRTDREKIVKVAPDFFEKFNIINDLLQTKKPLDGPLFDEVNRTLLDINLADKLLNPQASSLVIKNNSIPDDKKTFFYEAVISRAMQDNFNPQSHGIDSILERIVDAPQTNANGTRDLNSGIWSQYENFMAQTIVPDKEKEEFKKLIIEQLILGADAKTINTAIDEKLSSIEKAQNAKEAAKSVSAEFAKQNWEKKVEGQDPLQPPKSSRRSLSI